MDENAVVTDAVPHAGEQKKYIRTFGRDMEILQKGGTPDLAPFHKAQEAAPQPKPQPPKEEIRSFPVPPPLEAPPRPTEIGRSPLPLKTYGGDFSTRMKETRASTATVLAAEQDSTFRPSAASPEQFSRSGLIFSIAGVLLLILGAAGAYIAYTRYLSVSAPVVLTLSVKAPIFVDEREQIAGTGLALSRAIAESVAHPITQGAVRLLYTEGATTTSIFSALQEPAPGSLLRNISAASSMAGVIRIKGSQSPFFILSITSFSNTFAGMLEWERVMPRDLAQFFPPYASGQTASSTTATSTPVAIAEWRDEVIANHDARVYRDTSGRSVLLYGYWDQATLVIARDPAAFTEILARLATSHTR